MYCFIKQFSFRSLVLISKYLNQAWVRGTWPRASAHKVIDHSVIVVYLAEIFLGGLLLLFCLCQYRKKDLLPNCSWQEPFHSHKRCGWKHSGIEKGILFNKACSVAPLEAYSLWLKPFEADAATVISLWRVLRITGSLFLVVSKHERLYDSAHAPSACCSYPAWLPAAQTKNVLPEAQMWMRVAYE